MAAGSAALSLYVGQGAAAEPTKGLTETLCEPVTGTRYSCAGDRRKGERERDGEGLQQEEYKAVASVQDNESRREAWSCLRTRGRALHKFNGG